VRVRITFVLPFVNRTGGIRVLLDYANWLHDEGHLVTVVYPLWPYRYHFRQRDRFSEFRRQLRRAPRVEWFELRCRLLRVPYIANRFVPRGDLVLATSWPTAHSVARLDASRGKKVQIVFHHESGTGPEHQICRTYALPFHRIAFSESVRETIERQFACAIQAIVPNGVDTRLFFPDAVERSRNTVLMLYHNDPRKGADDGVEALALVRTRVPDVQVRMCGTVRPDRLPSWIGFDFHPGDAGLRHLYSTSTAFLYPSRYEGFGLPPLESMACGCPVVTTEVGAIPEFAADRCNALVVPPRDVRGMADRLEELLLNPALRSGLSERGRDTAERYALTRVAPLFSEALKQAFEGDS
jgi:glycosyltransferase involved in cell wall biosynthesis